MHHQAKWLYLLWSIVWIGLSGLAWGQSNVSTNGLRQDLRQQGVSPQLGGCDPSTNTCCQNLACGSEVAGDCIQSQGYNCGVRLVWVVDHWEWWCADRPCNPF